MLLAVYICICLDHDFNILGKLRISQQHILGHHHTLNSTFRELQSLLMTAKITDRDLNLLYRSIMAICILSFLQNVLKFCVHDFSDSSGL